MLLLRAKEMLSVAAPEWRDATCRLKHINRKRIWAIVARDSGSHHGPMRGSAPGLNPLTFLLAIPRPQFVAQVRNALPPERVAALVEYLCIEQFG